MKNKFTKSLALLIAVLILLTAVPFVATANRASEPLDKPSQLPKSAKNTETESKSGEEKTTKVKEIDVFEFTASDVSALYKAYTGKFMVSPIAKEHDNFANAVKTLGQLKDNANVKAVDVSTKDVAEDIEASFLFVLKNGVRRIYTLNKNNILQAGEKGYFQIPTEHYNALLKIFNTDYKNASFAQWLIFMVPKNVTRISYEDKTDAKPYNLEEEYVSYMVQLIRRTVVTKGTSYYPVKRDFEPGNGKSRIMLYFDKTDSYYTLWIEGTTLYVESSGLHIGTSYTISTSEINLLKSAFANPKEVFTPAETPAA